MPPCWPRYGFGRWCFLATFTPETTSRPSARTSSTAPRLPLSRPAMTITSSLRLILLILITSSEHFRRERNDPHERLGAQFARHGSEDAGADRLQLRIEQHRRVLVEPDQRSVLTSHA